MYKAIQVAECIINYANEINSPMSNLKLQKILYYVQATSLVKTGKKCFEDPITAWGFGPVVIDVYHKFKIYGRDPIPTQPPSKEMVFDAATVKIKYVARKSIDQKMLEIIKGVVSAYKNIDNPFKLVQKTHQEQPWMCTKINEEIDCKVIRSYYSEHKEKLLGWE